MVQKYEHILVAVDGSYESELAFEKAVNVALRNNAELVLTHVIDTRALQSVATFDTYIYDKLEQEAKEVLSDLEKQAREQGITNIKQVIEFGNPKNLLAHDIPEREHIDLIMVGATGLNTFERLLIGSSSEYIMRHAKVDLLVVRDSNKTL
ncbi:universal stress protein [Streptococcus uberis]|uniref:Universal stress protein n=2 Tax=Streptococcus uberis TaxID=1349 RepID=B9DVH8_STRU0|nr:universal stress protein [Streptococcus uberis]KHD40543.1 universal stress protein UspA [Streptococcus hongkongensis]AUC25544.1 universal stress protein [Streptococcus uberis]KKF40263.1 universal stress protein UspA [Streptococcus uberis Ab71]KKF40664.1 universal stress protein UspA [Streptococcus uberis C9359]KKF41103.1 universal stress protein UspA [Streptococcus uberis EF20/0145]